MMQLIFYLITENKKLKSKGNIKSYLYFFFAYMIK